MPTRNRFVRTGVAVLAVAALLRVVGLGFGLDFEDASRSLHRTGDERGMVLQELELLGGDWDPGSFRKRGTAMFYGFGALDALLFRVLAPTDSEDPLAALRANPSPIFLVHRAVVAAMGVLTVLVVMRMVRREVGETAALATGAILAVSFLHVRLSHFGIVDVPWVLFAALAVEQSLALRRDPRWGRYVAAGLWIGVSGATKYFGFVVLLHLLAAHLSARRAAAKRGAAPPRTRMLLVSLAAIGAVALVLSLHVFFWPEPLTDELSDQLTRHGSHITLLQALRVLFFHVWYAVGVGLGEPVLLLVLLGFVVAWRRGGGEARLAWAALFFLPTLLVTVLTPIRYGIGVLVFLAPVAGVGTTALLARITPLLRPLVFLAFLSPSIVRVVCFDVLLTRSDTRTEMAATINALGVERSDVFAVGFLGLRGVQAPFVHVGLRVQRGKHTLEDFLAERPEYILRELAEDELWEPFREIVEREYEEVLRLDGRRSADVSVVDPAAEPGLFVPYVRPWQLTRPGPPLVLYRRTNAEASPEGGRTGESD